MFFYLSIAGGGANFRGASWRKSSTIPSMMATPIQPMKCPGGDASKSTVHRADARSFYSLLIDRIAALWAAHSRLAFSQATFKERHRLLMRETFPGCDFLYWWKPTRRCAAVVWREAATRLPSPMRKGSTGSLNQPRHPTWSSTTMGTGGSRVAGRVARRSGGLGTTDTRSTSLQRPQQIGCGQDNGRIAPRSRWIPRPNVTRLHQAVCGPGGAGQRAKPRRSRSPLPDAPHRPKPSSGVIAPDSAATLSSQFGAVPPPTIR